jgi:hypothetical protein
MAAGKHAGGVTQSIALPARLQTNTDQRIPQDLRRSVARVALASVKSV